MRVVAIVPARSGSQGLPHKNIMLIEGHSLLERAVKFGLELGLDDVIVSTDSPSYAEIGIRSGATVPGLRSLEAATSDAMEPAVIDNLNERFTEFEIEVPDIAVWLRPTFVFRSLSATKECIRMVSETGLTASRVVTPVDPRVYADEGGRLVPRFNDGDLSMVRRQGLDPLFHVFNVDVFRWPKEQCPNDYLGSNIGFVIAPKLCEIDIDTEEDAVIAEALLIKIGSGIMK